MPPPPQPLTSDRVSGSFAKIGSEPAIDPAAAIAAASPPADNKVADLQKSFADIQEKTLKQMQTAEMDLNGIKIPDLKMPPKPQIKSTNPAEAWGSTAMVFATLGSLLTRRPLTTAMNAMAGVLKGFKAADQQQFDNSFKIWQAESQNAIALGSFELQAYHAALSGIEEKLAIGERIGEAEQNAALAKITATSAAFGDEQVQTIIAQHGLPGVVDMFAKRSQVLSQFQEYTQKGVEFKLFKDAVADLQKDPSFQALSPPEKLKVVQDLQNKYSAGTLGELTPDAVESLAQQLIAGDTSALYNVGRGIQGARNIAAIRNRASEILKSEGLEGSDMAQKVAEFQGIKAGERSVGTRSAQISLAANEAVKMADLALKASENVPRGQFVPLNSALQAVQAGTSSPQLARFVAATNSFVNVYARAITPSGIPRIADKEHAYAMLGTAMSQEAYAAVIDQLKLEMKAAVEAPAEAFKQLRNIGDDQPVGPAALTEMGGAAGASGGLPRITGDADYNALKDGAQFIDPDGNIRTKPGRAVGPGGLPVIQPQPAISQ